MRPVLNTNTNTVVIPALQLERTTSRHGRVPVAAVVLATSDDDC